MDYLGGDKPFEDSNFPYEAEPTGSPTAYRVLKIFFSFFREVESNIKFWIYGQPNPKCLHFCFWPVRISFRDEFFISSSTRTNPQSFGLFSIEPEA